ncbi:MAG: sulfur carrier protein ThiS [Acidimicrobiales bacterium]
MTTQTITVVMNGEPTSLPPDATVRTALDHLAADGRGMAVAINGEVAPRSLWDATPVAEGDVLEVLTVAQGG